MKRPPPRNAKLQERIASLQRELQRVEGNIEQLDSAVRSPDRESAAARLKGLTAPTPREVAAARSPSSAPAKSVAAPGSEGPGPADDLEAGLPRMPRDRRFASYFVTGSLQSVRPLRTERRLQRKKALIMVAIAIFLLYGVITALRRSLVWF